MKRRWFLTFAALLGFTLGALITWRQSNARHAAALAEERAAWSAERASLEAELERARQSPQTIAAPKALPTAPVSVSAARPSPADLIARLAALRSGGAATPAMMRQAVYWLEELALHGTVAVPTIRDFLARYEDVDLDTAQLQGRNRDKVPMDFAVPPSLRFGLFSLLRRMGGPEAEKTLGESLSHTGRGIEVAWLATALEEMAPGKYRDSALTLARSLLANSGNFVAAGPLDRKHRDYLFSVLAMFGDTSYAGEAQAQLVRADAQVDRAALKYLQQALGPQAVPIVAQAYSNPALTNSNAREPLARAALAFVGADAQANEFYQKTINDPLLSKSHRKNLIEDLNQDGFADTRNLTERDLPLIQNRISLIEQLAPTAMDDVNAAAFKEAYKDLVDMRAKVAGGRGR